MKTNVAEFIGLRLHEIGFYLLFLWFLTSDGAVSLDASLENWWYNDAFNYGINWAQEEGKERKEKIHDKIKWNETKKTITDIFQSKTTLIS